MLYHRSIVLALVCSITLPVQSFSESRPSQIMRSYTKLIEQIAAKEGMSLKNTPSGQWGVQLPKNSAIQFISYRFLPGEIELEALAANGSLLRRFTIVPRVSDCRSFTCIHEALKDSIRPFVVSLPIETVESGSSGGVRFMLDLLLKAGHRSASASVEEVLGVLLAAGAFLGLMGVVAGHTPLHPDENSVKGGCLLFVVCAAGLMVGGCLFSGDSPRHRVSIEQQKALEAAAENGDMKTFLTILDENYAEHPGAG